MDATRIVNDILHEDDDAPPRIRKFKDLINPFEGLSNAEIYHRYRFPPHIILKITDLINEDIE
uniref:Uncharacterized protein n=1 Tax=Romanomermis culicivorax TaxID=13658 RepID=A0A915KKP4_ROMCU